MSTLSTKRPSRAAATRERALRNVQGDTPAVRRLNVHVPEDLLRDIKVIAARQDRTISDIVREHLAEYRRKHSQE